ncbi:MAG: hypothetical protein J6U87_01030, partial [Clostridia bacterium]|nr:hypothetical protein [Clostridia bacterium]
MKKKMLQRLLALVLAVTFIFGGSLTIGAANEVTSDKGSNPPGGESDFEELNADAYEAYMKEYSDVGRALEPITIPAMQNVSATWGDIKPDEAIVLDDGTKLLFTPNEGTTTWEVDIPATAKYSIIINYMPDDAKTASIERILKIDGKTPFAEARFITLPKVWKNQYTFAKVEATKKVSLSDIHAEALAAGFAEATLVEENGESYVRLELPKVWTAGIANFVNKYTVRFFTKDIDGNEIRPGMVQAPELSSFEL